MKGDFKMSNKDIAIRQLYENIAKDKKVFNKLKANWAQESNFDKNFITKNLLPLAQKIAPEITCDDILEYENKRKGYSGLSEEELENVAGGNAATAILGCGFLALMGFLGGMTSNTTNTASAEFVPFSQTSEAKQLEKKEARDPTLNVLI